MMWTAIIIALIITTANFLASVLIARYAYNRDISRFSNIVLSSLVVRYMCMAILIWCGLTYFRDYSLEFALTFVLSTFIFIFFEIFFFIYYPKLFNLQKR